LEKALLGKLGGKQHSKEEVDKMKGTKQFRD